MKIVSGHGEAIQHADVQALASLARPVLACPRDRLRIGLVGGDGLEPPTLSV